MSLYDASFDKIIDKALNILFDKKTDIYTFSLYYDHETYAISVCADTRSNSESVARKTNLFSYENFNHAILAKDIEKATNWGRFSERNFSLGDFKFQSLGWEPMKAPNNSAPFFLAMVRAIFRNSKKIAALSRSPENLVFCCSSKNAEVGFIWSYQVDL